MTQTDLRKMVRECLADDSGKLTAWECDFLDSLARANWITDKQAAIVERIWMKLYGSHAWKGER